MWRTRRSASLHCKNGRLSWFLEGHASAWPSYRGEALQLKEFQGALQTPDVHSKLSAAGFEVIGSDGPGLDKHTHQEYERWRKFVQETKLKLEE